MRIGRSLLLTGGPLGLIALSYMAAAPTPVAWGDALANLARQPLITIPRLSETPPEAYGRAAAQIQSRLPETWSVVEHYPFVVTGNLSESQLRRALDRVVLPTYRALMVDYFDHSPAAPITLVLMADELSYIDALGRLGHSGRKEYAGIYSRRDRRLILNLGSGDGTLAHELTHALAHADFLRMPEWFDEGLAALHEECVFSADGRRLIGQPNWRDAVLGAALKRSRPPGLEELVTGDFGARHADVDYAFARNLCLYLQHRNLLGVYYRKCRARIHDDPTGGLALLEIAGLQDFAELDQDVRRWFLSRTATAAR